MIKNRIRCICVLCALALLPLPATAEPAVDMLMVDHRLFELGYRDEACNGELDEITIDAIKSFQRANELDITGQPDEITVDLLMSSAAKSEREYLSTLAYKYNETTRLAKGSYGESVTRLQRELKELGYFRSECDGAYGDATEAAVYRFRLANGLTESGVADGATQMRLYEGEPLRWEDFLNESCASAGTSGDHVRRLQLRLKDMGYFSGKCSGRFGEGTQQAVSYFQSLNNLEITGDADIETCRTIYSKGAVVLTEAQALRRGSTGAEAEKLCLRLQELGYPAASVFNTQTEIALLQFQIANGLEATGALDSETGKRISSGSAVSYDVEKWRAHEIVENAQLNAKLLKAANSRLGTIPDLDSSFEFVQYMYLKCGEALMDEAQLEMIQLADVNKITAGDTLLVGIEGRSFYGIATADGAVIYRAEDGYVVMSYLSMLDTRELYIWRKGDPDAA